MCSTIMNLLSLANEDSVPGADDFVPVLVFVLIKVGPSRLLMKRVYLALLSRASHAPETLVPPSLKLCATQEEGVCCDLCSVQEVRFS